MKLFKNYESKKSLRKKLEILKDIKFTEPRIIETEVKQKVTFTSNKILDYGKIPVCDRESYKSKQEEIVKKFLGYALMDHMDVRTGEPYVDYLKEDGFEQIVASIDVFIK